jgi:hypothetical protein
MHININDTPARPVTERDIDDRLRERAAVMEIADQLEREARANWPARRAAQYAKCTGACEHGRRRCAAPDACQQPVDEPDNLRPARGFVSAILITAVIAALVIVLSGCGGGYVNEEDNTDFIGPPNCVERPEVCR